MFLSMFPSSSMTVPFIDSIFFSCEFRIFPSRSNWFPENIQIQFIRILLFLIPMFLARLPNSSMTVPFIDSIFFSCEVRSFPSRSNRFSENIQISKRYTKAVMNLKPVNNVAEHLVDKIQN